MKVFLSFAWGDTFVARRIMSMLRQHNHDVDYDASSSYFNTVQRAIVEADAVIVLWSRAAASTRRVLAEAQFARQCNKPPVPVLLDQNLKPLDEGVWSGLLSKAVTLDFEHPDFFEHLIRTLEQRHIQYRGCEEISYFPEKEPARANATPAQIIEAPRPYENRTPGIRRLLEAVAKERGSKGGTLDLFDEAVAAAQPVREVEAYRNSMCGRTIDLSDLDGGEGVDEAPSHEPVAEGPLKELDARDLDGLRVQRVVHPAVIRWNDLVPANRNDRVDAMRDSVRRLEAQMRSRDAVAVLEEIELNSLAVSQGAAAVACIAAAAVAMPVISHRAAEERVATYVARGGVGKSIVKARTLAAPPTETRAGEMAYFFSCLEWHFGALVPPKLVQDDVYAFLHKFNGAELAERARSMCVMMVFEQQTVRKRWLGDGRGAVRLLQNRDWDVASSAAPAIEDYLDIAGIGIEPPRAPTVIDGPSARRFAPAHRGAFAMWRQRVAIVTEAVAGPLSRLMARVQNAVSARQGSPGP